jgi:hypothetical protein
VLIFGIMQNTREMNRNLQINEDWEREAQKDFVYLYEEQQLIEQEINRKPAQLIIVDIDNVLQKQRDEVEHNPLPF